MPCYAGHGTCTIGMNQIMHAHSTVPALHGMQ
jgi:hypothetical protein